MNDTALAPGGMRRRALLAAGAALVLARPPPALAARDTIRLALSTFPPNWRPFTHTGSAGGAVKLMLHRRLVTYDAQGVLRGELAERWEREENGNYVFHLRDDVRFQNGDPVDAEAVRYSMEQIADPKTSAYLRLPLSVVEKVEVADLHTVRFHLKERSATLPFSLASYNCPIVSPKSTDALAIGCGPYQIASQERGTRIEFVAFEGFYRKGFPKTQRISFINYADESLRVAALQTGDVDMIEYVPWQSMSALEVDPRITMSTVLDGPFMYLTFNCAKGPFTDKRLRQAVAFALNRDDVVKTAFFGRGAALEGLPSPPDSPFTDQAALHVYKRDLDRARQLMADAGMAGGFSTTILSTATYNMHKDTAVVAQQNLAEIGIQATLQLPDYPTRIALGNRGQFEIGVMGYGADFNDPDSLTTFLAANPQGSYPRSWGYVNPHVDDLLNRARAELDDEKRKALYRELTPLAAEDAAVVGVAWRSQAYAMTKQLQGYYNLPGALTFMSVGTLEDAVVG